MFDDQTRFFDIYGGQLIVSHSHGTIYEEYVIHSNSFPFEKWLSCTVLLTAALLHFGLHHHHTSVLSFLCLILFLLAFIKLHTKVKKGYYEHLAQYFQC